MTFCNDILKVGIVGCGLIGNKRAAVNEAPRRKQRGIFTGAMFLSPQAAGNLP